MPENEEKIKKLQKEISELETLKTKYQTMNSKISKGVEKLELVRSYVKESYIKLEDNYTSEISIKKVNEIKNELDDINSIVEKLNNEIIVESKNRINEISQEIERKRKNIKELQEKVTK